MLVTPKNSLLARAQSPAQQPMTQTMRTTHSLGITQIPFLKYTDTTSSQFSAVEQATFFAQENKEFSTLLSHSLSHFDVLLLLIEIMKLEIEGQEGDKIERRAEREAQLNYLNQEAGNLKAQAKWLLGGSVGAGILGMLSGAAPIVGHMKGEAILGAASSFFTSLQGAKKKDFFDGVAKMTFSMSEMQKATGQIYQTNAESSRTRYSRLADLHRTDHEEITRNLEDLKKDFHENLRILAELLQMRHEAASHLYR